ncbi:hypothetical protein EWH99_12355 [Sporolactobacillus sp. THM7-7]|nr:hypothetical protein EWH99_12355 [Sporolactobacillus sp. THM7-7]
MRHRHIGIQRSTIVVIGNPDSHETVKRRRDKRVIVIRGINEKIGIEDINAAERLIASSAVVLLQLNVPVGVVRRAAEMAGQYGVEVVLDPAPMMALSEKIHRLSRKRLYISSGSLKRSRPAYACRRLMKRRGKNVARKRLEMRI